MTALSLLLGTLALAAQDLAAPAWDARAVEHLLNRAGFGARPAEIARGVALGREALVDRLLAPPEPSDEDPFYVEPLAPDRRRMRLMEPEERREVVNALKRANRDQHRAYLTAWVERMLDGRAPLEDRMTLFWHGLFTSQISKVQLSAAMIEQNQTLRAHALGNYGELLRAMLRDPALLVYLDNDESDAEHPNENLSRELLELFSLGEGNYTERDVQEAARALTGHGVERGVGYAFDPARHDPGQKTVLGVSGPLDLDDVVDAILEQPACARHVAGRLLTYFEGVAPDPARLARYAALLRDGDYEVEPFLRALFLDPAFYRAEAVGARVLSPLDYLVGLARRTGVRPPPAAVAVGASLLGEELFEPPNVKGWEGGDAWITTTSLMERANLAGLLLGTVTLDDLTDGASPRERLRERLMQLARADDLSADEQAGEMDDQAETMQSMMDSESRMVGDVMDERMDGESSARSPLVRVVRVLETVGYSPRIHLTARLQAQGVASDGAIVDALLDELLGIQAPADTRRELVAELKRLRKRADLRGGELLESARAERILRRLAHLILSLPEAQLG